MYRPNMNRESAAAELDAPDLDAPRLAEPELAEHGAQVRDGQRFEFGKNWLGFVRLVDDERIAEAQASLREYLGDIAGETFLDIGSGSGLFSLAARRMGARVQSFDYDPSSVEATRILRQRCQPDDPDWTVVGAGSVLDRAFLGSLGQFDVVYAWGVLHHTGDLWSALGNVIDVVKPGGRLYLSVYNYQHYLSGFNTRMKKAYVGSGRVGKAVIGGSYVAFQASKGFVKDVALLRNPLRRYAEKKKARGMSMWHDWIDWVGGYPFEVAKPEEVFEFFYARGFSLCKLQTCGGGLGCNEFVFRRENERG